VDAGRTVEDFGHQRGRLGRAGPGRVLASPAHHVQARHAHLRPRLRHVDERNPPPGLAERPPERRRFEVVRVFLDDAVAAGFELHVGEILPVPAGMPAGDEAGPDGAAGKLGHRAQPRPGAAFGQRLQVRHQAPRQPTGHQLGARHLDGERHHRRRCGAHGDRPSWRPRPAKNPCAQATTTPGLPDASSLPTR
jgi:hypothetical protein